MLIEWLQRTRERLVERGWTRGLGDGGKRCLFMALEEASEANTKKNRASIGWAGNIGRMLTELKTTIGIPETMTLVEWNDQQSSVEPVLAAIDRTIERLSA